jgi:hypothetical protein
MQPFSEQLCGATIRNLKLYRWIKFISAGAFGFGIVIQNKATLATRTFVKDQENIEIIFSCLSPKRTNMPLAIFYIRNQGVF